jgi:hypothetical protein
MTALVIIVTDCMKILKNIAVHNLLLLLLPQYPIGFHIYYFQSFFFLPILLLFHVVLRNEDFDFLFGNFAEHKLETDNCYVWLSNVFPYFYCSGAVFKPWCNR